MPDTADFIRRNLRLVPVPAIPEIRLYTAHPGSGLGRLVGGRSPYWAYAWGGGSVLARHILDHPETVRGKRVLDLGAGGGIVAIAAALIGASAVTAAEIDPFGLEAMALNARANGVTVAIVGDDLLAGPPPQDTDLVLVGDLFYAAALARRVTRYLDRCVAAGIEVLVGDPGRKHLPLDRLKKLADYAVPDFAEATGFSTVYRFQTPAPQSRFA